MAPKKNEEKFPPMLDVILKQYLKICATNHIKQYTELPPPLNWKALANNIPNTTPELCQKRFYQLNAALKRVSRNLKAKLLLLHYLYVCMYVYRIILKKL